MSKDKKKDRIIKINDLKDIFNPFITRAETIKVNSPVANVYVKEVIDDISDSIDILHETGYSIKDILTTLGYSQYDIYDESCIVPIPKTILQNKDLSFKAIGLFCKLLSKYGTEFTISRAEILSLSKNDKSISIYSAIKELEEKGYLKRIYFGKIRKIRFILTLEI